MLTPAMGNKAGYQSMPWGADNGCFSQGDKFDLGEYLAWLGQMRYARATCLFATAPDVVGNWDLTLPRSRPVLPAIRMLGFSPALVAQDGATPESTPWGEFECLFVGGSTDWKLGDLARTMVEAAKSRGLWVHVGRVNSLKRLRLCAEWGADSADGTFVGFGPDRNLPKVYDWLEEVNGRTDEAA